MKYRVTVRHRCAKLAGATMLGYLLSIALSGTVVAEEESTRGLVAIWKFDEGSGNAVKDSSGHGNDGRIVNGQADGSTWGSGEFAGSVSLRGADRNHIEVRASDSLNGLNNDITVVAHVYPRSLWSPTPFWAPAKPYGEKFISVVQRQWRTVGHPDQFFLGYGPKERQRFPLGLSRDTLYYKWHLGLTGSQANLYRLPKGEEQPVVAQWVHMAGSYDSEAGKMALYINGKRIGSRDVPSEGIRLDAESLDRPLIIGAELNGTNTDGIVGEFDGYIEEVRIYSRVLSGEEIKALAREAKTRVTDNQ